MTSAMKELNNAHAIKEAMLVQRDVLNGQTKNQRQPSIGVLIKSCSENMQQIYKGTTTPKCDFSKLAKQLC